MATPNDSRRSTPSLLLQPPSSGFSWDPLSGSSFLLPVSQQDNPSLETEGLDGGGEPDSFIGQSTQSPAAPPISSLSGHSPHSAFKPVVSAHQTSAASSPLSQLQQPLRPTQSKSPLTEARFLPPSTSPMLENIQDINMSSAPAPPPIMTYGNVGPPPPTGPSQNFRRQAPFAYAPTPGMKQDISSPYSVPYSEPESQPEGPTLPDFQTYPTYNQPTYDYSAPPTNPDPTPFYSSNTAYGPKTEQTKPFSSDIQNQGLPGAYNNFYKPVQSHWFFRKEVEKKELWLPFSVIDSSNLEEAYKNGEKNAVIPTDGGRFDVFLDERVRKSVYWEETPCTVKRSSWFYRAEGQNRYVPYDEVVAEKIEDCFREGVTKGIWPQKLELGAVSEAIVMHNIQEVAHYLPSKLPDEWGYVPGQMTLRVVKRGVNEILTVEEGESQHIDHLVFLVQGVGAVCDLKFRTVVECVDDFRATTLNLTRTHFGSSYNSNKIGRVEVLPIAWHSSLHGDATGIDKRMQKITLPSIPKLRHFTNDTVMDIFFYTSPIYCQTIVDTVGSEINRIYQIFMSRNPYFKGHVSVAGHSLGSLILFDILAHQLEPDFVETPVHPESSVPEQTLSSFSEDDISPTEIEAEVMTLETAFEKLGLQEYITTFQVEQIDLETLKICSENDMKEMGIPMGPRKKLLAFVKEQEENQTKKVESASGLAIPVEMNAGGLPISHSKMSLVNRQDSIASINYMIGVAGTGQPSVVYPKLSFEPSCFFALGSPIAMFLTVRGIQTIGEDYRLPTCPAFFNIFHPYDPVAFRIETLIDPHLEVKPVLVPHHKGRKRLHLELRDSLTRVGTDLKQKLMDSLRHTWNSINDFARAHRSSAEQVEAELNRVVQEELENKRKEAEENESTATTDVANMEDIQIGHLNGGRRIDYVLQEKPIESFNQYLFALASHTCYWESEDTALMIIKEVYSLNGVFPEQQNSVANRVSLYNPAAHSSPSSDFINSNPAPTYNVNNTSNFPRPQPPPPSQPTYSPPAFNTGYDFTAPPDPNRPVAPPPLTGFVRASPMVKR